MLLIKNGVIITMDSLCPRTEAAVVEGSYFSYVGDNASAEAFARLHSTSPVETLDLQGRFLMPGFNDSHMHFIHYVKTKLSVDLFGVSSLSELKERMRLGLARFDGAGNQWLIGEGWNQEQFAGVRRFPTRQDLDEVSRDVPIIILRSCFHVGVLNSKALELMHFDREAAARFGVFVETDETGEPNGVIKENLLDDTKASLPTIPLERMLERVVEAQNDLFAEGLTSIQSDDFKYAPGEKPYDLMEGLRALSLSGRLKLRFAEQALLTEPKTLEEFFQRGGHVFGGSSRFRISAVKLLADGSLGARTAFLQEPYADAPDTCGLPIYPDPEALYRLIRLAHLHNMPAIVHVIGDGAAQMALDAIARVKEELPWFSPRHGLVHCQVMTKEQLRRMGKLGVTAFVQPVFINGDMHIAPARLGSQRVRTSYAWKDMARAGAPLAFGTDCPVERFRPMEGIYCAVTRRDFTGKGPFLPEQALSVSEALYAYTAGSAYASGEEHVKGKIRAGMLADFILMDRNLLTCPPEELYQAQVLATYVGGECVYRAKG